LKILLSYSKQVLYSIILLLCVVIFNFVLIHMAPGDAVTAMIGDMGGATPKMIADLRANYGLDQSFFTQLYTYVFKMMRGDLGMSFTHNQPVLDLILDHLPATILLVVSSLTLALFFGTLLGIIAAQKPNSPLNHAVTVFSLSGMASPVFWTGIILLLLSSFYIPIFPSNGMKTIGFRGSLLASWADILHHLVLPAITLASVDLAIYRRMARASMQDGLGADYIKTARSKGLSERTVVYKHALKNALLPVVTFAGFQFGQLIAGAVVVETVFSWPGIGLLIVNSIMRRDYPLLLGILFFSVLVVVICNLLTDLSYRLLDPRIK